VCNDRRATLQKVDMSGNAPKTVYSINPTAWQFWVSLATLCTLYFSMTAWIVGREFDQRLIIFHREIKPSIERMMDAKVNAHAALPAHSNVIERITEQEKRDAGADQQLEAIRDTLVELKAQNTDMNKKIDRLLERK